MPGSLAWSARRSCPSLPGIVGTLFVTNPIAAHEVLDRLQSASTVTIARSESDSPSDGFEDWLNGTGFSVASRAQIAERNLTLFQLTRRR